MKKLREVNLKQVNSKIVIFGFITVLIIMILYSCSTEDESIYKSEMSKTTTEQEKTKIIGNIEAGLPISVQENLNSFSEQISLNAKSLDIALYKNQNVEFNAQAMQMLNAATNEIDLKSAFEMAGITNSQEVIDILKNNVIIQQEFIDKNPNFYNLTIEERVELLNASLGLAENNYFSQIPLPSSGLQVDSPCSRAWKKNNDKCLRNYGVCSVGSIAAAFIPPFWPALVAAATCF
jgi:hypothetical protein